MTADGLRSTASTGAPSWLPVSANRLAALARGAARDGIDVFAQPGVDARDTPARRVAAQAIVAAYAGAAARIVKDARGKPSLPDVDRTVSVAHVGHVLVVAIGRTPLGVDIELSRPRLPWRAVYDYVTAPEDRMQDPQPADFLASWTAKEAVVKLLGDGLNQDLRRVRVPPGPTRVGGNLDIAVRRLPDYGPAVVSLATIARASVRIFALEPESG